MMLQSEMVNEIFILSDSIVDIDSGEQGGRALLGFSYMVLKKKREA